MCHSGVGLTPTVDGVLHQFSAGGLSEGVILLVDDATRSYWDHITGEAVHGPLKGRQLEVWPLRYTNVEVALAEDPQLQISRIGGGGLKGMLLRRVHRKKLGTKGFIPPPLRLTMSGGDERLPEHTQGVGIFDGERARFYPMSAIKGELEADWGPRRIRVFRGPDGVPQAVFVGTDERPMQLFSRWYGFAATFPGCELGA